MPGVSTITNWASGRVTMPLTARLVVCGLSDVMAIFAADHGIEERRFAGVRPADETGEA